MYISFNLANSKCKAQGRSILAGSMLNYLCDCTNPDRPTNSFSFCTQNKLGILPVKFPTSVNNRRRRLCPT